jgi:hypothetical protein
MKLIHIARANENSTRKRELFCASHLSYFKDFVR